MPILDAFAKLWKADVSFVVVVRPSVRMEQLGSTRKKKNMKFYISVFLICRVFLQVSLKSDNNNQYFTWRPMYIYENI